eukprot:295581_1
MNGDLCAQNRNHSIPLCGSCNNGYSQVFNSPNCKICDNNHWEYLCFPIVIAFLLVFLLILCDTNQLKTKNKMLMIQDETEGILILMVRVFVLFYQSINYILWINGYTFWGTFIIQILA